MNQYRYCRIAVPVALVAVQYLYPALPAEGSPPPQAQARDDASTEQKDRARTHFEAGNQHLRTAAFAEAVAAYRTALRYWQHPRIHYNLGVALLNLDQPVEAYEAITEALRHGAEPLGAELHEQANNYQELLRQKIGVLEVTCAEVGAQVTLNGKPLFRGPGAFRGHVRVGRYQIVATKPGYLPAEVLVTILPGKQATAAIAMRSRTDGVIEERLIERTWVPWAVAGAGGALLVLGGAFHVQAHAAYGTADERFAEDCPTGCSDDAPAAEPSLESMQRARWLQSTAIGAYAIGGAVVLAGLTLAYLNQPEVVYLERSDTRTKLTVTPTLMGNGAGLWAAWTF